jgi:hypothetical protein
MTSVDTLEILSGVESSQRCMRKLEVLHRFYVQASYRYKTLENTSVFRKMLKSPQNVRCNLHDNTLAENPTSVGVRPAILVFRPALITAIPANRRNALSRWRQQCHLN